MSVERDEEVTFADEDDEEAVSLDSKASHLAPSSSVGAAGNATQASTSTSTQDQHQTTQTSFLLDADLTPEEQEEKARLIAQVLELQNTLDDLSSRVDNVKEENLRLRSENQVLGQYIENLMAASSVFQPANEQPRGSSRRK